MTVLRAVASMRVLAASLLTASALVLAGCNADDFARDARANKPIPEKLLGEISEKNMEKTSPILVRIFKQESELEVWKQDRSGRFSLLKTYPICRWSGELGPKIREGDRQAPEGFYTITPGQMNPNSAYYLSFNMGYPNAFDKALGRTGSQLMVHGDCSSRGCYAMTDEQISEIYALGRESFFGGQRAFQVQAYPFRMTPKNMAKHRNNPHMAFWKMLKQGYDHFEVSRMEPKVEVCEKHYVFDPQQPADATKPLSFSPTGKCPVYEVPQEIAEAVAEKNRRDEAQVAELVGSTPTAPVRTGSDGGMHPVFANKLGVQTPNADYTVASYSSAPGTIPGHVNPPKFAGAPAANEAPATQFSRDSGPVAEPAPSTSARTAPAASSSSGSIFDRMSRAVGLGGNTTKPAPAQTAHVPVPERKPASVQASHAPAPPTPKADARAQHVAQPALRGTQGTAPNQSATAKPAASQNNSTTATIAGAQPVRPSSSFENRWSAFQ